MCFDKYLFCICFFPVFSLEALCQRVDKGLSEHWYDGAGSAWCHLKLKGSRLLLLKSTNSSAVGFAPQEVPCPSQRAESTEPHMSHFLSGSLVLDCVNCCQHELWVRQQVKYKDVRLPTSTCRLSTWHLVAACPVQPLSALPFLILHLSAPYKNAQWKSTFSAKATHLCV